MATNNFPNIGYTTYGRDWNFFQRVTVTATTFGGTSVDGYQPDMVITFPTEGLILICETTGSGHIVEYSFNGTTVHGELNAGITTSGFKLWNGRSVSKIWFRIKTGNTGPVIVSLEAWAYPPFP